MDISPNTREVVISFRGSEKQTIRPKHELFFGSTRLDSTRPVSTLLLEQEKCRCLRCCGITRLSMYKSQSICSIESCARLTTLGHASLVINFRTGISLSFSLSLCLSVLLSLVFPSIRLGTYRSDCPTRAETLEKRGTDVKLLWRSEFRVL